MKQDRFFAVVALFVGLVVVASHARADKVHLRDKRVLEGKVIAEDGEQVEIELRYGTVTVPRDNVVKIEYERTSLEALEQDTATATDPDQCMEIAKRALEDGVDEERVRVAYEKAVRISPDFEPAHKALGHFLVNGKWLAGEEAKIALGLVKYEGEWVRPEEADKRRAARKEAQRDAAREAQAGYEAELRGVSWGAAHEIESDHYIIKCNSTREVAERYSEFMEKIYEAYDDVFKGYKRYFKGKSTIYIFRNIEDFQEYGGGQPGVGGFYRPESPNTNLYPNRVVSAYHGTFGLTGDTREVLAHEGTHQFQHILCDGTPRKFLMRPMWWVEGLAVYFGDGYTFDKKGDLEIGIPRDRLMSIQAYIRSGNPEPLSKFIRRPQRAFSGFHYAPAWSLCHYFLHRGEETTGRGRKKKRVQKAVEINGKKVELAKVFKKFFEFVTQNPPDSGMMTGYEEFYAKKLEELLGFPIDDLTEDWKAYVLGIELEPLGELSRDGKRFISKELAFEISKPGSWEWQREEVQGREAIRIENASTSGLVVVMASANMDNESPEGLKDRAERNAGARLDSPYIEETNEIEVNGYSAYEIWYEGTESAPANATREVKVRPGEQRFRHVVIATMKRAYEVIMQADKDRFDENKADFEQILNALKILEDSE